MNDNVLPFNVPPKQSRHEHEGFEIVLTFVTQSRRWRWEVEQTLVHSSGNTAGTENRALAQAKKHIDDHLKLENEDGD